MHSSLPLLGLAIAVAHAHFVLQIPTSLGFDDNGEVNGPCGGFDATNRTTVTNWSVNGDNIGLLSTHASATWDIHAALLSDTSSWVPMVKTFVENGTGNVCFTGVPGISAWTGQDAVLQVIQQGSHGSLYQCAAIKFVAGGPAAVPSGCTNAPGISIAPIVAAPGPTATSSTPPTSSSKSTPHSSSLAVEGTSSQHPTGSPIAATSTTAKSSSNVTAATASPSKTILVTAGVAPSFPGNGIFMLVAGLLAGAFAL